MSWKMDEEKKKKNGFYTAGIVCESIAMNS